MTLIRAFRDENGLTNISDEPGYIQDIHYYEIKVRRFLGPGSAPLIVAFAVCPKLAQGL